MCSSNFVYWSILSTFAMHVIFLFVCNWHIETHWDFTARFVHENHTRMFETGENHGGDHRIDLRERRLSEHANWLLIQCPSLRCAIALLLLMTTATMVMLMLMLLQLFVTVFHFKSDVNYWSCIDSWIHLVSSTKRGIRISWFWSTAINSLSNGFFLLLRFKLTALQTHKRKKYKIGCSNT